MSLNTKGELYRIPTKGKLTGVCAGIAEYFGWEAWLVRVLVVSAVLLGMQFLLIAYIAAWFILDKKPGEEDKRVVRKRTKSFKSASKESEEVLDESIRVKAKVWQSGEPPRQAFFDIKRKFTVLEKRLRKMEQHVTSAQFNVAREINKL